MQIEFKFLTNQVLLPQNNWNVAIPEQKEVLSFALVESLAHLLYAALIVLYESLLELTATGLAHLVLE